MGAIFDLDKLKRELREFSTHLENTKEELLDSIDSGAGYLQQQRLRLPSRTGW